ncbi:MAG: hypothetical protein ISP90_03470 [Nevskia sp.]|nr:hypothetical protein [Nevskia sp.]
MPKARYSGGAPRVLPPPLRPESEGQRPDTESSMADADAAPNQEGAAEDHGRSAAEWSAPEMPSAARGARLDTVAALRERPGLISIMPRSRGRTPVAHWIWFAVAVAIPGLIAASYFGFIATGQYTAELRYSVRSQQGSASFSGQSNGPAQGSPSLMSAAFGSSPGGVDVLDNYTVSDYVLSRQALADVGRSVDLRKMFGRPAVDRWSRLAPDVPAEQLERYWQRMVYSSFDPYTGLAIVRVRAFTPEDAFVIANGLSNSIVELVDRIGGDARRKTVEVAQHELDLAQQKVLDLRRRERLLREREQVIDPGSGNSVVAGNVALSNNLRANQAQIETSIAALAQQLRNPDAPEIQVLKAQLAATQRQLQRVDATIGSHLNGNTGLAQVVGEFEDLDLERSAAEQVLLGCVLGLQQAKADADALHLYVSFYEKPLKPESATYPRRLLSTLIVILAGLMIWIIGILIANSVVQHGR